MPRIGKNLHCNIFYLEIVSFILKDLLLFELMISVSCLHHHVVKINGLGFGRKYQLYLQNKAKISGFKYTFFLPKIYVFSIFIDNFKR